MTPNDDRLSDLHLGDHFGFRHSPTFEAFDTEQVAIAVARVEKTGALDLLARWRDEDAPTAGRSVRAALIPQQAVLVGLLLLADEDSPLWINSLAELLQHRLTAASRALLGLPESATTDAYDARARKRWYSATHSAFHRMVDLMDAFPQAGWKSHTAAEVQAVLDGHDPARETKMKARLDQFTSAFLQMTFREQPRRLRPVTSRIDIALGTTFIASRNRTGFSERNLAKQVASEVGMTPGERRPGPVDVFAGWYVRTENQSDAAPRMGRTVPAAQKVISARDYGWGWAADIAVRVDSLHPNERRFPQLAISATMRLPGDGAPEHALSLMRSALDTGLEAGIVDMDRAYFANYGVERLQEPIFRLGFTPSADYRADRFGVQGSRAGAELIEGRFYCPAMPRVLKDASKDRLTGIIDEDTFHARRQERIHFELRPKGVPDSTGSVRMMCPAVAPSPTVICPLREEATGVTERVSVRVCDDDLPDLPDRICIQRSVTFSHEEGLRQRQAFTYGSAEWEQFHRHARRSIEALNAVVGQTRTSPRVNGFAAAQLFLTLRLASMNLHSIRSFLVAELRPSVPEQGQPRPTA